MPNISYKAKPNPRPAISNLWHVCQVEQFSMAR